MSLTKIESENDEKLTLSFVNRPRIVVEQSRPLPVPVIVSHFTEKTPKIVRIIPNRWSKQSEEEPPPETSKLCKWFKKRKALKSIARDHLQEKKKLKDWEKWRKNEEVKIKNARIEKARLENEQAFIKQMISLKREKERIARKTLQTKYPFEVDHRKAIKEANEAFDREPTTIEKFKRTKHENQYEEPEKYEKPAKAKVKKVLKPKIKKEKKKKIKLPQKEKDEEEIIEYEEKPTKIKRKLIKPKKKVETSYVTVKRKSETLTSRFVNSCYRICCEFYCWMTIIILIGLTIFCIL